MRTFRKNKQAGEDREAVSIVKSFRKCLKKCNIYVNLLLMQYNDRVMKISAKGDRSSVGEVPIYKSSVSSGPLTSHGHDSCLK